MLCPPTEAFVRAACAPYRAQSQGLRSAREAIARVYQPSLDPDNLQLFASTSEAFGALIKLVCAPGDVVICFSPSYPLFDCLCALEGVELLQLPLQDCADEWAIDFWALEQVPLDRVCAVIAVSPNNPTGHCLRFDEARKLADFCAERELLLIVDEVFAAYRFKADAALAPEALATHFDRGLIVSLSGFSKLCGLPQHKLAWGIFGGDPALVAEALERMQFIADAGLSVSTWIQHLADDFISRRHDFIVPCLERCRRNLDALRHLASGDTRLRVPRIDAGWSAVVRLPSGFSDEATAIELADKGVRCMPGSFFGFEPRQGSLVLSLIVDEVLFAQGIARIFSAF